MEFGCAEEENKILKQGKVRDKQYKIQKSETSSDLKRTKISINREECKEYV